MASTSTNKQPLLVDNVMHEVVDLTGRTVLKDGGVDLGSGANSAILVVDATSSDGCIIESIYAISRKVTYTVKLFLSNANDYLRPDQGIYIGEFEAESPDGKDGKVTEWDGMPKILAPMPQTGTESQFRALYIPRRKALWAAVEVQDVDDGATEAPLLGVQGGWY